MPRGRTAFAVASCFLLLWSAVLTALTTRLLLLSTLSYEARGADCDDRRGERQFGAPPQPIQSPTSVVARSGLVNEGRMIRGNATNGTNRIDENFSSVEPPDGTGSDPIRERNETIATGTSGTASKLHCWRNSTLNGRGRYDLLVTGCGYSSTGFFATAFSQAGYPLGHETMRKHGTVDWKVASRHHKDHHPFLFNHVVLLVRHPLKVLNSWYGTKWNFGVSGRAWPNSGMTFLYKELVVRDHVAFESLRGEFKVLEWWTSFTLLAEDVAQCFMRAEDISAELLLDLCAHAGLDGCASKDWASIVASHPRVNTHIPQSSDERTGSWELVEGAVSTELERQVLDHARATCERFGYGDC